MQPQLFSSSIVSALMPHLSLAPLPSYFSLCSVPSLSLINSCPFPHFFYSLSLPHYLPSYPAGRGGRDGGGNHRTTWGAERWDKYSRFIFAPSHTQTEPTHMFHGCCDARSWLSFWWFMVQLCACVCVCANINRAVVSWLVRSAATFSFHGCRGYCASACCQSNMVANWLKSHAPLHLLLRTFAFFPFLLFFVSFILFFMTCLVFLEPSHSSFTHLPYFSTWCSP